MRYCRKGTANDRLEEMRRKAVSSRDAVSLPERLAPDHRRRFKPTPTRPAQGIACIRKPPLRSDADRARPHGSDPAADPAELVLQLIPARMRETVQELRALVKEAAQRQGEAPAALEGLNSDHNGALASVSGYQNWGGLGCPRRRA
jgi:hypothetical protein